jgi:uncharacterized small protein (DUF1192 family)
MIKYENAIGSDASPAVRIPIVDIKQDQAIHRLETLVVTQNQKIAVLEREIRRIKNDLRIAISAFNANRANQ